MSAVRRNDGTQLDDTDRDDWPKLRVRICHLIQPTSDLPTWPRWLSSLQHFRRGLASGLPVTSCTGSQRWTPSSVSEPSVMSALLPGTVCHNIFRLSQTLSISRNFSKLTCLHRHFTAYIVCRNMKCPPVYFVGGQYFKRELHIINARCSSIAYNQMVVKSWTFLWMPTMSLLINNLLANVLC